ncbi:hypothetical protein [Geodermatophilus sp. CPCC 206100]|uniref:hypothetical protein n=1 Tax=Geodermatophilus sp. CPCC 206100 TaxID=3020054 RepID=UPI003AFF8DD3
MSSVHWVRPDIAGDVVAIAFAPGAAPPREIRIRPELYERMLAQMPPDERSAVAGCGRLGSPAGVPLVVDPVLPEFPGYEIVRARPEHAAA